MSYILNYIYYSQITHSEIHRALFRSNDHSRAYVCMVYIYIHLPDLPHLYIHLPSIYLYIHLPIGYTP